MVLDRRTGEPYTNAALSEGTEVGVIAAQAPPIMRTKQGLALMGPEYFGFPGPYVPVEKRLARR